MRTDKRRAMMVLAAALLVSVSCTSTNHTAEADLVAHQAIYRLELSEKSPPSRFNGISGAAVSVIERSCQSWTINEQVVMTMLTNAGGAINREMIFKAQESADGTYYKFDSKSVTNGNREAFKGSARRSAGNHVEAEFIQPTPREMPLPDGTKFYMGMTRWLVELANSGQRTGETFAFDGTDDEGPNKVTAFILPSKTAPDVKSDPVLLRGPAWTVRLAFFKTGDATAAPEPEFEIQLRLLNNGIVTHFELIFDDLIVDQILEDVLPAKDERCS